MKFLNLANEILYQPAQYCLSDLVAELESVEYEAATFMLNNFKIIYRKAKITPVKLGQFVTIWYRNNAGITTPFDAQSDFDAIIITVINGLKQGQFVFTKKVLAINKIISSGNMKGKCGIRIYEPWLTGLNTQATKTQAWQAPFFIDLSNKADIDILKFKNILS
jgi:hypothetical protein